MNLLLVRLTSEMAEQVYNAPGVGTTFSQIVAVAQRPPDRSVALWWEQDHPDELQPEQTRVYYHQLIKDHGITHAIICQPLLWYSEVVAEVCRMHGVKVFWTEAFLGGLCPLDAVGCHYTQDNEIVRYEACTPLAIPELYFVTKHPQPTARHPAELLAALEVTNPYDCVMVFGQVPGDMSLKQTGGLTYEAWLDALLETNPDTIFLFKHHPFAETELVKERPRFRVINEDVHTLLNAFPVCAAYSSTVIFEGLIRGCRFVTGGYHTMRGLTHHVSDLASAGPIRRLAFTPPYEQLRRRLSFLTRWYFQRLDSLRTLQRLLQPAAECYR